MNIIINFILYKIIYSARNQRQAVHALYTWSHAVRVFVKGRGDRGSIPGRVILKTQKMILDAVLLNTQHYKVWIKIKVEQYWERSSALPYTSV